MIAMGPPHLGHSQLGLMSRVGDVAVSLCAGAKSSVQSTAAEASQGI